MAKQGNWNKSFWKKLNDLGNTHNAEIRQIMLEECGKVERVMQEKTPKLHGGLKSSIYAVVVDTEDGISARVGYTHTPHWDLDPSSPHQDSITNPNLIKHLYNTNLKNYDTYANIDDIAIAMEEFQENIRIRINNIFSGGK